MIHKVDEATHHRASLHSVDQMRDSLPATELTCAPKLRRAPHE